MRKLQNHPFCIVFMYQTDLILSRTLIYFPDVVMYGPDPASGSNRKLIDYHFLPLKVIREVKRQ